MTVLGSKEIRRRILEEKLIENYIDLDTQIQPAGFDLTMDKIGTFKRRGKIDFYNKFRWIPEVEWMSPESKDKEPYWILNPGTYMITLNERVNLPLDLMADTVYRSSVMRCGVFTGLGRWDPGYNGVGVSLLVVHNPHGFWLFKNARICQMKFEKVEGIDKGYDGQYQHEGQGKSLKSEDA